MVDTKIVIPIGFDIFKGYKITAYKYFEITPTSISDSKWEMTFGALPPGDSLSTALKNLLDAYFSTTLQLKPYLSLEFMIGDIGFSVEAGVKFPLVFTVKFDQKNCLFPHLNGSITIPIKMYIDFSGLVIDNYEIIKEYAKELEIYTLSPNPFCIGGSRSIKSTEVKPEYTYMLQNTNFKDKIINYEKQLVVTCYLNNSYYTNPLNYPLALYDNLQDNRIYYLDYITNDYKFIWRLKYFNEKQNILIKYPKDYELKVSDLKIDNNNQIRKSIEISLNENDKTYFDSIFTKTQKVNLGVPFSPEGKIFSVEISNDKNVRYELYYLNDNNTIVKDTEVKFYRDLIDDPEYISYESINISSYKTSIYIHWLSIYDTEETYKLRFVFYKKTENNKVINITTYVATIKGNDINDGTNKNDWDRKWRSYFYINDKDKFYYAGKMTYSNNTEEIIEETYFEINFESDHVIVD